MMTINPSLDGRRVRLVHCDDPYTTIAPGTLGTVLFTDDAGTLHIKWDNGSRLGLCADAGDRYELVPS